MQPVDLSSFNLAELKKLQQDIEQALKNRQQEELQKARQQILAIAQEAGVSVAELLGTGAKTKTVQGRKVEARYKNPNDPNQVWSGRGRQPKWIESGLKDGKSLDDFRI